MRDCAFSAFTASCVGRSKHFLVRLWPHSGNYVSNYVSSTVSHIACSVSEVEHSLDTVSFMSHTVLNELAHSGKLSREKTFATFEVL